MIDIYFGTDLVSLDASFDGSYDVMLERIFILGTLESTHVRVLGSDESVKMVLSSYKVRGTIFGNVHVITLGLDVGTEIGSLDGSSYGF